MAWVPQTPAQGRALCPWGPPSRRHLTGEDESLAPTHCLDKRVIACLCGAVWLAYIHLLLFIFIIIVMTVVIVIIIIITIIISTIIIIIIIITIIYIIISIFVVIVVVINCFGYCVCYCYHHEMRCDHRARRLQASPVQCCERRGGCRWLGGWWLSISLSTFCGAFALPRTLGFALLQPKWNAHSPCF